MSLHFSHMSPNGYIQSHYLQGIALEIQLDVLNRFVAFGYRPLAAYLIDEDGSRIDLPIEVFDGHPMGEYMRELQGEYQTVLSL